MQILLGDRPFLPSVTQFSQMHGKLITLIVIFDMMGESRVTAIFGIHYVYTLVKRIGIFK